ncbi:hypothetical protein [Vibrio marinisediminis]|nr:hypothetical protein [Vibrio marinisediminis]
MSQEFKIINGYLPEKCESILDIGCGMAGIDLFLNQYYKDRSIDFFLLDKNEVNSSVYYDFNNKAAFYNSLDLAKSFLNLNGISESKIKLLFANDENEINIEQSVDMVISLISWGFHYPVDIYLERVYEILSDKGTLIIDVRKGNNGFDMVKNKFSNVEVIVETSKYYRVKAIK